MPARCYNLSDEDIKVLEQIKEDVEEVTSIVGAIRFLIKKYQCEVIEEKERAAEKNEEIYQTIKQMKKTISYNERNSEMIVNVLNTICYQMEIKECVLSDEIMHPVLAEAQEHITRKIEKNKQKKDFRNKRR